MSNILVKYSTFIKDSNADIDDLIGILQTYSMIAPIYEKDSHLQTTLKNDGVTTIPKYMRVIGCYTSFFNFELLQSMFDYLNYEEGKSSLKAYEKEFAEYAKRRIVPHCPSGVGMKDVDHVCVDVKLDDAYEGCKTEHIKVLQKDIGRILKVKVESLPFDRVVPGCISVIFHLPVALKDEKFPLSLEQIKALQQLRYNEARVLRISCGDYTQEIHHDQGRHTCSSN